MNQRDKFRTTKYVAVMMENGQKTVARLLTHDDRLNDMEGLLINWIPFNWAQKKRERVDHVVLPKRARFSHETGYRHGKQTIC